MRNVIVIGEDHSNTVGMLQSLGLADVVPYVFLVGPLNGIVDACRYSKDIVNFDNSDEVVSYLINHRDVFKSSFLIPCSDMTALSIDDLRCKMKDFSSYYTSQYSRAEFPIRKLQDKEFQVSLAKTVGFKVPRTWKMKIGDEMPADLTFPCIIKPMVSIEGSKSDLLICYNKNDFSENSKFVFNHSERFIVQTFIEKDFDYNILGVSLQDGSVIIKKIIRKDSIYPLNVGHTSFCTISDLKDSILISSIQKFIKTVGFVGLFSCELVGDRVTGDKYFCEFNFRNDGLVSLIRKSGVNLPYIHYCDFNGCTTQDMINFNSAGEVHAICEMQHFQSMLHQNISIITWINQIRIADFFMVYDKSDKKPLMRQFLNMFIGKLGKKKSGI